MMERTGRRVRGLVDHLFRREWGRMVARLTRSFGPDRLDLAEEVVQDALVRALRVWPYRGIPDHPVAWLYRVAHNLALDRLRRDARLRDKAAEIRRSLQSSLPGERGPDARMGGEITDDALRLVFLCCHPALSRDARVTLTLKTVAGFSIGEIARGLLVRETTVSQRIVRARRRIREHELPFEVPRPEELPERLDAVLEVIYLAFNEGYAVHDGDRLVRSDLCDEALRLVDRLTRLPSTDRPEVHALAALLLFQASRLGARLDADGELVVLSDQDRSLWDRRRIARGFAHLERAGCGDRVTTYHLEAGIAARHAAADSDGETDWASILDLYDRLVTLNPSPVVALNRAVAVSRVRGARAGLAALEGLAEHPALEGYFLLPATRGELLLACGEADAAEAAFREALSRPCTEPERRFLTRRAAAARAARKPMPDP